MGKVGAGNLGAAVALVCAGELSGAPTGISQRWLGIPWAGFMATFVVGVPDWLWGVDNCTGSPPVAGALAGAWVLKAPLAGGGVVTLLFLSGPQPVKITKAAASKRYALFFMGGVYLLAAILVAAILKRNKVIILLKYPDICNRTSK